MGFSSYTPEKSEFNSSIQTLTRYNELWEMILVAKLKKDINAYFYGCKAMFEEMTIWVQKRGMDEFEEWRSTLRHLQNDVERHLRHNNSGNFRRDPKLEWRVDDVDTYLRTVFEESGLGLKVEDALGAIR